MIVRQLLERRVAGAPREALPDQPVPPPTAVGPVRVLLSFTSLDVHPLPLQVLDLVHPSLYPLVYGLSRRVTTTDTEAPAAAAQAAAPLADGPPSSALQPVQEVPANGQAHGIVEGSPACACAGSDGTGSGGTGSDPLAPNGGAATASGIGAGTGFNTGTSGGTRTADAAGEGDISCSLRCTCWFYMNVIHRLLLAPLWQSRCHGVLQQQQTLRPRGCRQRSWLQTVATVT